MDFDQTKESRYKNKHVGDREQLAQNYKHRVDKFIHDVKNVWMIDIRWVLNQWR